MRPTTRARLDAYLSTVIVPRFTSYDIGPIDYPDDVCRECGLEDCSGRGGCYDQELLWGDSTQETLYDDPEYPFEMERLG